MINDIKSDEFQLKYEVSQGTWAIIILNLFTSITSLLISKVPQIKFTIFADVILNYQTLPLNNHDKVSLINCTNNICNWLINNNLLLNIDKTQHKLHEYLGIIIGEHMLLENRKTF